MNAGTTMKMESALTGGTLPPALVLAFSVLVYLAVLWPRLLWFSVGPCNQKPLSALTGIMLLSAVGLFIVRTAVLQHYARRAGQFGMAVALFIGLIGCKYISAFSGQDPASSVAILNNALVYLMSFFVVGLAMFTDPRNEARYPKILLTAGLVAAVLGIYEMLRQNALTVEFGWIFTSGGSLNLAGENLKANMYRGGSLRAKSTFVHPIVFGQYIAACLPLVFLIDARGAGRLWRQALAFAVFSLAMIASNTRSPFAVAIISLATYWGLGVLASGRSRQAVALAVAGAGAALLMFLVFGEDLLGLVTGRTAEEVSSSQARNVMFERAFFALDSSPVLGYGEGRAPFVAGIFGSGGVLTIDSLYLSYLIDNGYLGAVLFVLFFSYAFWLGLRALRRLPDEEQKRRLRAVMALTFALLFGQAVLSIQDNLTFAYLGAAYIVAVAAKAPRQRQSRLAEAYLQPSAAAHRP